MATNREPINVQAPATLFWDGAGLLNGYPATSPQVVSELGIHLLEVIGENEAIPFVVVDPGSLRVNLEAVDTEAADNKRFIKMKPLLGDGKIYDVGRNAFPMTQAGARAHIVANAPCFVRLQIQRRDETWENIGGVLATGAGVWVAENLSIPHGKRKFRAVVELSSSEITSGSELVYAFSLVDGVAATDSVERTLIAGAELSLSDSVSVTDTVVVDPLNTPPLGMVLWLETDFGVYAAIDGTGPVPSDGARVGSWRDQSSNAFLFTRGASLGPFYQTGESPSGKPALDFAAASDTIISKTGVTDLIPGGQREFTAALVLAGPSTGGAANDKCWISQDEGGGVTDKWIIHNGSVASTGKYSIHLNGNNGNVDFTGAGAISVGATISTRVHRRAANGDWILRSDGVEVVSGNILTLFSTPNTGPIEIGKAEGGNLLTGEIFAILIYPTALSDAEVLALESYLSKYF